MKDNSSYLINVANIDTAHKTFTTRASGEYVYLEVQVKGINHTLYYGMDKVLRDTDYDRLKEAGQY
jgi:ribosomal protein L31